MRNLPQYLLVFFLGAGVGAVAVLVSQPGFSLVVTTMAPSKAAPAPAVVVTPVPVAVPVAKVVEPIKPVAPVVTTPTPVAVAPVMVAVPTPAAPGLDFAALTERPVFWPPSVTLTTATSVPVLDNGKRVSDLSLKAGSILQLSKVLATGAIEARAQGQKFEIDSKLTDFEALVRKKVQEVVEKGDKTLSPILSTALAATPTVAPSVPVVAAPPAVAPSTTPMPAVVAEAPKAVVAPARPTFDDKVNALFGRKAVAPEKTEVVPAPSATSAPAVAAPTAAAAVTPPTPAADTKAQDKKVDLDRRMNGIFGTSAK